MITRPVKGFENKYEVTRGGRILNKKTGRELFGYPDKDGYIKITLTINRNKQVTKRRARLVAEAWIPNKENLPMINHINGIKHDDGVSNLEWCSAKHNTNHAWKMGLCKPYDRSLPYKREGIILSNKNRIKKVAGGL